jgi:signal transduction histidine kinase/ActR/RegA family two-component response regulator
VISGPRLTRSFLTTAVVLLAVLLLGYLVHPLRAVALEATGWTLTATFRTAGIWLAWRATADPQWKRAWGWLAIGSAIDLAAQLYADSLLGHGGRITATTLADVGYIAVYPFFFLSAWDFLSTPERRRPTVEILFDSTLLTLTVVAWAFELFVQPLLQATGSVSVLVSVAYATGGTALLWLIGMLLLRPSSLPVGGYRLAIGGLVVYSVSDILLGIVALPHAKQPGMLLDFGWNGANVILGLAGALAAARPAPTRPTAVATTSVVPRLFAVLTGFAGLIALFVRNILTGERGIEDVVLPLAGGAVVAARVAYSLLADRRYETALEREVERQTHTLMGSLTAAASAERNLRQIVEASPDPIVLVNRDGRVIEFAPVGTPSPNTQTIFDTVDPEATGQLRQHLDAAFAGEVRRFEIPQRHSDGGRNVSSVVLAPIREHGEITKVLAISRDVTELRRAQSQLQQADKLAAMGQLVSGVAHEINNPAAIISGFAQTLMLDDLRPDQREIVEMVRDEAMRIGQITTNLLAFARMSGPERSLVDVNELVRRTYALRAYHLNTLNVSVKIDLDTADPRVWANVSELQQMLLNFLINAEQALESHHGARAITLRTRADATEVRIECRDSGPGIPSEIKSRIFDPFFTTKPEGVGTGLGLSICYGIVRSHGGRIWVDSEPGKGAGFLVALPLDLRTMPRPNAEPVLGPTGTEPLSVLVVDDEPGIRQATARFLNRSGMQVRAVSDGAEALRALRGQTFDVILCDVRMPGMNGRDFLIRLREQAPVLISTLIFATGDTLDTDTAALLADAGAPSLVKPFDFDALERLVRDVAAKAARANL